MDWKSQIFYQVKDHKRQCHVYNEIITHYNRLLETNAVLRTQNVKLEDDVKHLRLANAGLEKASIVSQEIAHTNDKLTVANEEVMMHLREKGELAQEVLRLNHALTNVNEKLTNEEAKVEQYTADNELLTTKNEKFECEVNELVQINEILREEFLAVQIKLDQLQTDYALLNPTLLQLQQQLDIEKRLSKRLEEDLMESKRMQLEMLDAEVKRYDKQFDPRRSETVDDDRSSAKRASESSRSSFDSDDRISTLPKDPSSPQRRSTITSGIVKDRFISSLKQLFIPEFATAVNDNFSRTSTHCFSASLPTREVNRWECTELEVYALQFQPSGSILATGCSDKMVHLWEISSSGQPRKYCSLQGSHGAINALDFDNEGARLLAGCSGDKAFIWSYSDYRVPKDTITGHNGQIHCCKFISGTKLTTGSADRLIKVWDLPNRQCIRTLFAGSKCHDLVIIDAAGTIISGHFDKRIRIWDAYNDKCRTELPCDAVITSLSYNAEKQQLLACLKDDTLQLIDLRQNRIIYTLNHDRFQVSTDTSRAILSPDGRYACAGSHDGSLFVWNTSNAICENVLSKKHTTMVTAVAWHPEGRYVASCEKHRNVILWSD